LIPLPWLNFGIIVFGSYIVAVFTANPGTVLGANKQFSRNPMYFVILIVRLAWTHWIDSVCNLISLALFVYTISKTQIKPEQEPLRLLFGKSYAD